MRVARAGLMVIPRVPPALAFVGCLLIWATTWIVIREGVRDHPPLGSAALRTAIASLLLLGLALLARAERPTARGAMSAALVGLFLFGGNLGLIYVAEQTLTSSMMVILYSTFPLQTALLAPIFLRGERITWRNVSGGILGLVGVFLSYQGIQQLSAATLAPAALAVLAATAAAMGTVLARRAREVHPLWINAIGNLAATLALGLAWLALERGSPIPKDASAWFALWYLAVFGSVGAFVLYVNLLQSWTAARAAYVGIGSYGLAILIGVGVAGEPVTAALLLGAATILTGAILSLRPAKPPRPAPDADLARRG